MLHLVSEQYESPSERIDASKEMEKPHKFHMEFELLMFMDTVRKSGQNLRSEIQKFQCDMSNMTDLMREMLRCAGLDVDQLNSSLEGQSSASRIEELSVTDDSNSSSTKITEDDGVLKVNDVSSSETPDLEDVVSSELFTQGYLINEDTQIINFPDSNEILSLVSTVKHIINEENKPAGENGVVFGQMDVPSNACRVFDEMPEIRTHVDGILMFVYDPGGSFPLQMDCEALTFDIRFHHTITLHYAIGVLADVVNYSIDWDYTINMSEIISKVIEMCLVQVVPKIVVASSECAYKHLNISAIILSVVPYASLLSMKNLVLPSHNSVTMVYYASIVTVTCLLFDPGGGCLPLKSSHDCLGGKYTRNAESSVPKDMCVGVVEWGLVWLLDIEVAKADLYTLSAADSSYKDDVLEVSIHRTYTLMYLHCISSELFMGYPQVYAAEFSVYTYLVIELCCCLIDWVNRSRKIIDWIWGMWNSREILLWNGIAPLWNCHITGAYNSILSNDTSTITHAIWSIRPFAILCVVALPQIRTTFDQAATMLPSGHYMVFQHPDINITDVALLIQRLPFVFYGKSILDLTIVEHPSYTNYIFGCQNAALQKVMHQHTLLSEGLKPTNVWARQRNTSELLIFGFNFNHLTLDDLGGDRKCSMNYSSSGEIVPPLFGRAQGTGVKAIIGVVSSLKHVHSMLLSKLLYCGFLSFKGLTNVLDLVSCFGSWIGLLYPMRADFAWDPGVCVISAYILEDKDDFKWVGKRIVVVVMIRILRDGQIKIRNRAMNEKLFFWVDFLDKFGLCIEIEVHWHVGLRTIVISLDNSKLCSSGSGRQIIDNLCDKRVPTSLVYELRYLDDKKWIHCLKAALKWTHSCWIASACMHFNRSPQLPFYCHSISLIALHNLSCVIGYLLPSGFMHFQQNLSPEAAMLMVFTMALFPISCASYSLLQYHRKGRKCRDIVTKFRLEINLVTGHLRLSYDDAMDGYLQHIEQYGERLAEAYLRDTQGVSHEVDMGLNSDALTFFTTKLEHFIWNPGIVDFVCSYVILLISYHAALYGHGVPNSSKMNNIATILPSEAAMHWYMLFHRSFLRSIIPISSHFMKFGQPPYVIIVQLQDRGWRLAEPSMLDIQKRRALMHIKLNFRLQDEAAYKIKASLTNGIGMYIEVMDQGQYIDGALHGVREGTGVAPNALAFSTIELEHYIWDPGLCIKPLKFCNSFDKRDVKENMLYGTPLFVISPP